METAQTITDVRKVEMYESKLVPNCGQFYTITLTRQNKLFVKMEIIDWGQIPKSLLCIRPDNDHLDTSGTRVVLFLQWAGVPPHPDLFSITLVCRGLTH